MCAYVITRARTHTHLLSLVLGRTTLLILPWSDGKNKGRTVTDRRGRGPYAWRLSYIVAPCSMPRVRVFNQWRGGAPRYHRAHLHLWAASCSTDWESRNESAFGRPACKLMLRCDQPRPVQCFGRFFFVSALVR